MGILEEPEEVLTRRVVEWQEALERKELEVNANETEVIVCTRQVGVAA